MDESWSDDSDPSNKTDEAKEVVQGKKYLVFESEVYKLFTKCPQCYSPIIHIKKHMTAMECNRCSETACSQVKFNSNMANRLMPILFSELEDSDANVVDGSKTDSFIENLIAVTTAM